MVKPSHVLAYMLLGVSTLLLLGSDFTSIRSSASTATITPTPIFTSDYLTMWDFFPIGLVCSKAKAGLGPTWRNITVGTTTLKELEAQYGKASPWHDMQEIMGDGWTISVCVEDDVITAIKVGSDLPYLNDYIALYGEPDAVTYSQPSSRLLFWFEEGIATDVYINTYSPIYYGTVNWVVYFPYKKAQGYKTRWPYNSTQTENISAQDENVSDEQNPFDFEAIIATITAQPTPMVTLTAPP